ncbi:MAG: hypothetical protein AAF502_18015 [Bacteroidota bacterium]
MLRTILCMAILCMVTVNQFAYSSKLLESVGVVQGFTEHIEVTIDRSAPPINNGSMTVTVKLLDFRGNELHSENTTGSFVSISTSGYASGTYSVILEMIGYTETHYTTI